MEYYYEYIRTFTIIFVQNLGLLHFHVFMF